MKRQRSKSNSALTPSSCGCRVLNTVRPWWHFHEQSWDADKASPQVVCCMIHPRHYLHKKTARGNTNTWPLPYHAPVKHLTSPPQPQ
ncbi:hypothetical protein BDZ85DRAFT_263447 [Elsinoe ampelina]|uniref:Uncharacterized protein n=1 Tax=Elsinoe ampelina TaxID=302913 RepID=A0A6A6G9D7_9PEZI|nr:hypothetical protein BDZ85DRAFT_263447 [Elsinoe ampelina]